MVKILHVENPDVETELPEDSTTSSTTTTNNATPQERASENRGTASLLRPPRSSSRVGGGIYVSPRTTNALMVASVVGFIICFGGYSYKAMYLPYEAIEDHRSPPGGGYSHQILTGTPHVTAKLVPENYTGAGEHGVNKSIDIYLGNGCFWERQWAYYVVETDAHGPFARAAADFSGMVGYAGGDLSYKTAAHERAVCYHTNDERDYSRLGHAEVVQITLDLPAGGSGKNATEQLAALAKDFFESFSGPDGQRIRPDPMDQGAPYRSVVGLPGGIDSEWFRVFERENAHRMQLKKGAAPGERTDPDERNTVWVYDTAERPFFRGEVYHQNHCNFFASEGMPYPDSYTVDLWNHLRQAGRYVETNCPEDMASHRPCGSYGGRR